MRNNPFVFLLLRMIPFLIFLGFTVNRHSKNRLFVTAIQSGSRSATTTTTTTFTTTTTTTTFIPTSITTNNNFQHCILGIPRGGKLFPKRFTTKSESTSLTDSSNNNTMTDTNDSSNMEIIGGGAINEKKRTYGLGLPNDNNNKHSSKTETTTTTTKTLSPTLTGMPPPLSSQEQDISTTTTTTTTSTTSTLKTTFSRNNRAHLMHAIEGLDRYPHYLSRWTLQDTQELEYALEQTLEKVRNQKVQISKQRYQMQQLIHRICQQHSEWDELVHPPTLPEEQSWDELLSTSSTSSSSTSFYSSILDPRAKRAIRRSKMFHSHTNNNNNNATLSLPSLSSVLASSSSSSTSSSLPFIELDAGYLQELMEEECFDVYSFPIFTTTFCNKLVRYIRHVMNEIEGEGETFANINRGMIRDLDNLGLSWLNDLLFHLFVRPISRHLYTETENMIQSNNNNGNNNNTSFLDWRQGFVASYSHVPTQSKPRQRLVPHTDDAEVTLNICLGDVFTGGNLKLWGLRGTDDAGRILLGEYEPQIGRALLHSGRHLHEVTEITSGDRFAYIMWTRAWNCNVRSQTCPCCWMNNRGRGQEQQLSSGSSSSGVGSCICGPRWN